ncbi:MAG: patatin-like phospholipase family protein, partial [Deltaproteobacteria bacterium]|nr:patatin-like phospholipase family protein [Deltaproteobacteria bacterium]
MKKLTSLILIFFIASVAGCAHYQINSPLTAVKPEQSYRFENLASGDNSDSLFVILSFSGGGTRAAALSYGVLTQLRDTQIRWEGAAKPLLQEVDVISSISGGSFTAAYYALFRDEIFQHYEKTFLKENVEGALALRFFGPAGWFRLASPNFDRIDIAAEYYHKHIFREKTFAELIAQKRRPFIMINATDMTQGSRFEFTQDQFDYLCSDLGDYPVANAVAASSAFPILLSPVVLRNYAGSCGFAEPEWITNALEDRDVAARRFTRARQFASYRDVSERKYLHLLDGGIADNIGLRGPLNAFIFSDTPWSLLRMIGQKKVQKVVFIVVNAGTNPDSDLDKRESPPNVKQVVLTTINAPMDNYSFETISLLADKIREFEAQTKARKDCEDVLKTKCPEAALPGTAISPVKF